MKRFLYSAADEGRAFLEINEELEVPGTKNNDVLEVLKTSKKRPRTLVTVRSDNTRYVTTRFGKRKTDQMTLPHLCSNNR